jgi:hypothetical protein
MASANQFHYVKAGRVHFFCPLCHHHQSTNTIRRVSWKNIAQLGLLTATATFLAWPFFGEKGIAMLFPFWAGFEFFYRLRKRQALICESCGFDPFLYKQDVQKARAKLRQHWEKRIANENLFAGKKLKNYRTNPVGQSAVDATQAATSGAQTSGGKNTGAAPSGPSP